MSWYTLVQSEHVTTQAEVQTIHPGLLEAMEQAEQDRLVAEVCAVAAKRVELTHAKSLKDLVQIGRSYDAERAVGVTAAKIAVVDLGLAEQIDAARSRHAYFHAKLYGKPVAPRPALDELPHARCHPLHDPREGWRRAIEHERLTILRLLGVEC